MGIRRSIRPIGHTCQFNGVGERFVHQPWGLFGGEPGACGRFYIENKDGVQQPLAAKASSIALTEAKLAVIETPGAGGYGDPRERAAAAVADDVASGKFSPAFIAAYYPQSASAPADAPRFNAAEFQTKG